MNTIHPLVSIGLPVRDGENYLAEALDSILAQTLTDFELILSDNASTDGTQEICERYASSDSRIRYIRNAQNLGAGENANQTVRLSRGKYYKLASHDDMIAPRFLERCVNYLEQDETTVVCYTHTILIDQNYREFGEYVDDLHLRETKAHQRFRHFFNTQGLCNSVFGVIRRSTLMRTTLFAPFPMSDRVLLGELALYGLYCEIPEKLFIRRIHPLTSTNANKTAREVAIWFDPKNRYRLVFPHWQRLLGYISAIHRAPLPLSEKANCLKQIVRFTLHLDRWSGLATDLWQAAPAEKMKTKPQRPPESQE